MAAPETSSLHEYGATPSRADVRPKLRVTRLLLSLFVTAASVFLAAAILPGFDVGDFWAALLAALVIGLLTAVLSPLVAAVQLPFTVATSFLMVLVLDAVILLAADRLTEQAVVVDGFLWALLAALVISAVSTVLEVVAGTNDDDAYTLRVIQRIARRSGERTETNEPGMLFLEIGHEHADAVVDLVASFPALRLEGISNDLQNIPRVAIIERKIVAP